MSGRHALGGASRLPFPSILPSYPCSPSFLHFPPLLPSSTSLLSFPPLLPLTPYLLPFPSLLPSSPSDLSFPPPLPVSPSLLPVPSLFPSSRSLLSYPPPCCWEFSQPLSHFGTVTRRNALPRFPLLSSPAVPDSNTYIRLGSSSGRTTIATSTVNGIRIVKFVPIQASLADPSPHSPSSSHSSPHSSPPLSSSSSPASSSAASPRFSAPAAKSIGRGRQAVAAAPDGGTTETVVGPRFEFVSSPPYDRQRRAREPSVEEMREVLLGGEVGQALDGNAARAGPSPVAELSYELVQGALVRWSEDRSRRQPPPPTAVLIHGILGSGKNWGSFARRLATEFPAWQFLCVDLRCHGASTAASRHLGPHSVHSAAKDVLHLMGRLRITPRILIGHSFGGKVALSMIDQAAKPMPSAIKVWVLDATPGKVRAGGDGEDHPADLIDALRGMPPLILDRSEVVNSLLSQGFSKPIAQWMTTNLSKTHLPSLDLIQDLLPSQQQQHEEAARVASRGQAAYGWAFDLEGISQMYSSYERKNLCFQPTMQSLFGSDRSVFSDNMKRVVATLYTNLVKRKSKQYDDEVLAQFFLMNNVHYIVECMVNGNLKEVVGEEWICQQHSVVEHHAKAYLRLSWRK
ncbi:unnamed protein product, partial [Closterium sp. Naga37s-1]